MFYILILDRTKKNLYSSLPFIKFSKNLAPGTIFSILNEK